MTALRVVHTGVSEGTRHGEKCECPPPQTCCELDCLVQPRFFCGQLLTDADLTAILKWAEDKFRLARYRHGWGVVCGLNLRCGDDKLTTVVVDAGYAMDCCGNDIVLCEPLPVKLAEYCRPPKDACAQPVDRRGRRDEKAGRPEEPVAFNLFAVYDTEGIDPKPALGRGSCGESGLCQPSRTRSIARIAVYPVSESDDLTAPRPRPYARCLEGLDTFPWPRPYDTKDPGQSKKSYVGASPRDAEKRRNRLIEMIDHNPQSRFCSLRERVCDLSADELNDAQTLAQILFEIIQDCRAAEQTAACQPCGEGEHRGVPLGRVWVLREAQGNRWVCRVLAIDDAAPYRRPLAPFGAEVRSGGVDISSALMQRPEHARDLLAGRGVMTVAVKPYAVPASIEQLRNDLASWPTVVTSPVVALRTYDFGLLGMRVVGAEELTWTG